MWSVRLSRGHLKSLTVPEWLKKEEATVDASARIRVICSSKGLPGMVSGSVTVLSSIRFRKAAAGYEGPNISAGPAMGDLLKSRVSDCQ